MTSEFSRAEGIAWLVMLCIASLSWLLFSLVLLHFRTLLRSLDLILAGLMVRNIFYALVAAPVLVSVALSQSAWTLATCRLLVFSLHMPLLVSMVGTAFFAVDRLFLLRKDGGPIYNGWVTNKVKPLLLLSICCCSAFITGLVPVNLWARITSVPTGVATGATGATIDQYRCRFLPSQLDYSYSMVLLTCNLASAVFCAVCCFDGLLFLRQQRRTALAVAAAAARDGTPADSVATVENGSESLKSHQQQQQQQPEHQLRRSAEFDAHKHSWESWRVTSLANAVIFFCNHLPLLILDFASLVALRDGSGTEYITMLLVESIVLPNSLWIFAVRYRHVVKRYFYKLSQQPSLLEDRYCAMQMFQKRCTLMGSMYRGHRARSLASTYFDSSTMDRHGQLQGSSNGRLARIHEIGHVTLGLSAAAAGVDNPAYYPSRHQLDGSSGASSFANTDRLTHSTGSTGTEWDSVQLHQLPVSSGEQVRAIVHPLGTVPEIRQEEEELDDDTDIKADDDENRIDAVIVSTGEIETAVIESPIVPKAYADAAASQPKYRTSSSNSSSSLGDNLQGNAFYLSEADLQEIARQRQMEEDAVKDYRRPRRQPNELERVQFPMMYVNPLMRSVSGFSDDFSTAAKISAPAAAAAAAASMINSPRPNTASNDQGNNFSQELDSYL